MGKLFPVICLHLFFCWQVSGQDYVRRDDVPVTAAGSTLPFPWAGGLSSPQFCGADLNNDGIEDIYVYDKIGQLNMTFIQKGAPGMADFVYDPQFAVNFPTIEGWVVLEDYNCDDIKDLFTYNNGSIKVYEGYYDPEDKLAFTQTYEGLIYPSGGFNVNLYNSIVDKASVVDVNGDGDKDIISFNVDGTRLVYYENQRIEDALPCDSLRFDIADRCWGNIYESGLGEFVDIRDTCTGKFLRLPGPLGEGETMHVGSTVSAADYDKDGDVDVLLGDVSFSFINYLTNNGDASYASILEQDTLFPASRPLRINAFPSSSLLDVNNDGIADLVFSPFKSTFADNVRNVHLYTGTASDWLFEKDDFLVGDMIDVGEGAAPGFFDWSSTGKYDLLLGNAGERFTLNDGAPQTTDGIRVLQNSSTTGNTSFALQDDYIFAPLLPGLKELSPEGVDLDGDSDPDLLVGESTGRIYWLERTCAGTSDACFANRGTLKDGSNNDIDVGLNAVPALADLDRDGLPDLIIGERNGNLNYYRNFSSGGNVRFQLVTDSLGKVRVGLPNPIGYSAPDVNDYNNDGKWDLLLGTLSDNLVFYSNIEDNLGNVFTASPRLIDGQHGLRTIPNSLDLNSDGFPEIAVGNFNGGVQLYSVDLPVPVIDRRNELAVLAYPNPAGQTVHLVFGQAGMEGDIHLLVTDMLGRTRFSQMYAGKRQVELEVKGWEKGLYILRAEQGGKTGFARIVVH